jgi:DNA-binding GntR family transcriptional regulator
MSTHVNTSVYQAIRGKIVSGRLRPGERLSEYAEAKSLGMSRGPIREAVSKLVSEGLVEKFPGIGAFVRGSSVDEIVSIFGFREALEGYAAQEAASRIDAAGLAVLRGCCGVHLRLLREMRDSGAADLTDAGGTEWIEADRKFHGAIVAAAGNEWIERHVNEASFLSGIWGRRPDPQVHPLLDLFGVSHRRHTAILAALRRRDPAGAREAMSLHIRFTRDNFVVQAKQLGHAARTWPLEKLRRGRPAAREHTLNT